MIEGENVRLRPWEEADIRTMMEIRNDVALQSQLLARVRGSAEVQVRQWLQDRSSAADGLFFIVADRESNAARGFIQLSGMDLIDRRAELGICLVQQWNGRGIGTQCLQLVISHLRENWGLRKLSLRVRADNAGAIACYRKVGFEECGRLREHVCLGGVWHDLVLMDLFLHREP
jgi:RimJ/RimL family protein N-acetyltransferase